MLHVGNMHTTTNFDKGLVTNITPIDSVWGEISWKNDGLRLALGSMPYVVKGDIDVRLPNTIDAQGIVHYDTFNFDIQNSFSTYTSMHYVKTIKQVNYSVGGYSNSLGFYQTEVKAQWIF
jgi:hypothetical protein